MASKMDAALQKAQAASESRVFLHPPVDRNTLVDELQASRVLLYRGDPAETFCLAVAEAQALGVPWVVQDYGSMSERVRDGETGYVTRTDEEFAARAVQLLTDDALWLSFHRAAIEKQRSLSWDRSAAAFESLHRLS